MSIFNKIVSALFPAAGTTSADRALRVYVRCNACKEALVTRINPLNDLSMTDDEGYITRKTIIGSAGCYRPIEVVLHFDGKRNLTEKEISGGTFITAEAYQAEKGNAA